MNPFLLDALEIISGVDAEDASTTARGNRAHARVMAMLDTADQISAMREQSMIKNLLTVAALNVPASDAALAKALEMLERAVAKEDAKMHHGSPGDLVGGGPGGQRDAPAKAQ